MFEHLICIYCFELLQSVFSILRVFFFHHVWRDNIISLGRVYKTGNVYIILDSYKTAVWTDLGCGELWRNRREWPDNNINGTHDWHEKHGEFNVVYHTHDIPSADEYFIEIPAGQTPLLHTSVCFPHLTAACFRV